MRFDIESKLSTVTKTFVVKDTEFRVDGGRGMARGVRSTVLAPCSSKCGIGAGQRRDTHVRAHYQSGGWIVRLW